MAIAPEGRRDMGEHGHGERGEEDLRDAEEGLVFGECIGVVWA